MTGTTEASKDFGFKLLAAGKALIDKATEYMNNDEFVDAATAVQVNLDDKNGISFVKAV